VDQSVPPTMRHKERSSLKKENIQACLGSVQLLIELRPDILMDWAQQLDGWAAINEKNC
jgi:hypothetical protein